MSVPATLTLAQATAKTWSALVVGAGPAGAVAAGLLARAGLPTLLVDRAGFPRSKVCGCCLNGRAQAALSAAGLADLTRRLGGVAVESFQLGMGSRSARLRLGAGVSLSREAFDAALVRHAVDCGADFLPATRADCPAHPGGTSARRVVLHQTHSEGETAARVVLAADGLGGTLLRERDPLAENDASPGETARVRPGSRIGLGVVVAADAFYRPGTIYMATASSGYVGVVRLESGQLDVACALDPAAVRTRGPGPLAAQILEQTGWPAPAGLAAAPWRGTLPLTRTSYRVSGERLLGLGDATGYVEPFTGEGMAWALTSAVAVVPYAVEAARAWRPALARLWRDRHREVVTRRQRACRIAAEVLRRPWLVRLLIAALARVPVLARPVVQHLNAPADAGCSPPRKIR